MQKGADPDRGLGSWVIPAVLVACTSVSILSTDLYTPSLPHLPALLGNVSQIAVDSGVTLRRMNPGDAVQLAALGQHTFQFDVEGKFDELFDFLRQIEALKGMVWANHLRLEGSDESDELLLCELSLTVFTDNRENSD